MDLLDRLPRDVSQWSDAISSMDSASKATLGRWLLDEWIDGRLEPRLLTGPDARAQLTALRSHLSRTIASLGCDRIQVERSASFLDESTVRRWCWIGPWVLWEQDEDLLMMADEFMVPMLDEAASDCTKRDYAIGIVAHHVRDQIHVALRRGPEEVRAKIRALGHLAIHASAARDKSLVAYLARVDQYERPQKVGRDDAVQRMSDLWRCAPPPTVVVEQAGDSWRSPITRTPAHEEWIVIDRRTGAMRLEAPGVERARRKGRHSTR